jgi:hypothetical protein
MKSKTLSEEVLRLSKRMHKLFLEQDVGDLGVEPSEPIGEFEPVDTDITATEVGKEAYGNEIDSLISAINDSGVGQNATITAKEDPLGFEVDSDGKVVTFEFYVLDAGEPVVVAVNDGERITVSLAPLIGYVTADAEIAEKLLESDDILNEFIDFVAFSISGGEEGEINNFDNGEWQAGEGEEGESGEGEGGSEGGSEGTEGEGTDDGYGESARRRRIAKPKLTEQSEGKVSKLAFPAFYKKFKAKSDKETQPDLPGFVGSVQEKKE